MIEKAKQIAEGWKNVIIKDEDVEILAKARLEICQSCVHHSENAKKLRGYKTVRIDEHCTECGCPLMSKTRCTKCECPIKKWLGVSTEEA